MAKWNVASRQNKGKDLPKPFTGIHPITRAPVEVVSTIFKHCLPTDQNSLPLPLKNASPINVSCVCKQWREIALSTPQLWSGIQMCVEDDQPEAQWSHILERWISRSGNIGFSFVINQERDEDWYEDSKIGDALDVLIKHSLLWVRVKIFMDSSTIARLMSVVPRNTPRLKELTIYDENAQDICIDLFSAPLEHLRELSLIAHATFGDGRVHGNLSSIALSLIDTTEIINCLSHCPRLEELYIRFKSHGFDAQSLKSAVGSLTLPCLRTLKVRWNPDVDEVGYAAPLFDVLQLPCLMTLFINIEPMESDSPWWDTFLRFFKRLESPLENLEIWGGGRNGTGKYSPALPHCLALLPGLKYIGLPFEWLDELFRSHSPKASDTQWPNPQLKTFRVLSEDSSIDKQGSTLLSAVEALMTASGPQNDDAKAKRTPFIVVFPGRLTVKEAHPGVRVIGQYTWMAIHKHDMYGGAGQYAWDWDVDDDF
ncbi:hypothetical protein BD410DRAFT_900222 [Rickenella mellea]|uniref:F-box domain-containing protein n=1 Tax=Rickenella mellea TaxID=50990 RepID=A0A4Y7PWT2_9AGAM|nr:hypothetical protein BD410DRAFT_900222 [Rickenella mellea]